MDALLSLLNVAIHNCPWDKCVALSPIFLACFSGTVMFSSNIVQKEALKFCFIIEVSIKLKWDSVNLSQSVNSEHLSQRMSSLQIVICSGVRSVPDIGTC